MTKNIYIFSGLGCDERVFREIELPDNNVTFIQWVRPQKGQSIESYAGLLKEQILHKNPILIGLSFGGMMAMEVAKIIDVEKIILIASAKTKNELPFYYKLPGLSFVIGLLPAAIFKFPYCFIYKFFGAENDDERHMLKGILKDTDPVFLKWALSRICCWQNLWKHIHTFHIHGSKDLVLPVRYVSCNKVLPGAGHFMTVNRADMVQEYIWKILKM